MKKNKIKALFATILEEMERNAEFRHRIEEIFEPESSVDKPEKPKPKNRREPAVFDPIEVVALKSEPELKAALDTLNIEQLKDIVAQFRFDPSRLVMKWKDKDRIIEHIIKSSQARDQKGDVFRE